MTGTAQRSFYMIIFFGILAGCFSSTVTGGFAVAQSEAQTDEATPASDFYVPPVDSTPTPTPFQPLPPTPVYLPTSTPAPTATPLPTATPTAIPQENTPGSWKTPAGQINILLLGSDARPWDVKFRTDTIILATINPQTGTVNLTSFPRDLFINIPGWGQNRINTAYQYGGFKLLSKTLAANFDIQVDHYVLINFSSFKRLVDSLGGLEVEVGQPLTDYRPGYGYVNISEGRVKMDADMVLWYVRSRKTTNDFARNRRQQEIIQALLEKFLSMDAVTRAPEFYEIYKDSVTTNLSFSDMLPLLPIAANLTDPSKLNQYYIGPKQVYDWITPAGAMVLMPRPDEIRRILRKSLNIQ